jgi:hypothetical protein
MAGRFTTWLIRFGLMAVVYVVIANFVIDSAQGWDRLGRFAAAIAFGINVAAVWAIAIGIGLLIPSVPLRALLHPILMLLLFLTVYVVIAGWAIGTTAEFLWRDLEPFAALIVGVMALDAIAGFVLERRLLVSRTTS